MAHPFSAPTPTDEALATPVLMSTKGQCVLDVYRGGLEAAFSSATGLYHTTNEDYCVHSPSAHAPVFCAVADGVGGGAYGDVASQALIEHCLAELPKVKRSPKKIVACLREADTVVRKAIAQCSDKPGASTLVAAWFLPFGRAHIVTVGDCRAYRISRARFRGGFQIKQITEDQTYSNLGLQAPAKRSPDDPACMVGSGAVGLPKVISLSLSEDDLLLLCSDGLHKFLRDDAILGICERELHQETNLKQLCNELVRSAKLNGSYDDISVLLVRRRRWFGAALHYWIMLLIAIFLQVLVTTVAF